MRRTLGGDGRRGRLVLEGPEIGVDGPVATAEAQRLDLSVQLLDVGAAIVPPLVEVGFVVIEPARPSGQRARHQLIDAGRVEVAARRPRSQAQFPLDRSDVHALGLQLLDLAISLPGPDHPGPVLGVLGGCLPGRPGRIGGLRSGRLLEDGVVVLDAAMVGGNGLLHVVAQVIPHVPPVGNLPGIGRALPAAQREAAGPVPADQPDTRMSAEPLGEGAGLPVGEDVDDAVGVHVQQDAGVRLATPLGPVIYAEHRDLADLGIGQRPDQPDQRAPGHDRAQCACQPGPRTTGQRERDPLQQAPQSDRAALVPGGQPVHLLGERRHDAGRVVADEPADPEYDLDRTAAT